MMKKLLVLAAMAVVVLGLAFALNSLPASESPRVYASSLAGISGAGETGINVQNLDQSMEAQISADFYPQGGGAAKQFTGTAGAGAAYNFWLPGMNLADGAYAAVVNADRQIAAIARTDWPSKGGAAIYSNVIPDVEVQLPLVTKEYGDQCSLISIQNTNTSSQATAVVDFFAAGSADSVLEKEYSIQPGTSITLRICDEDDFITDLPANFLGSVVVTSKDNVTKLGVQSFIDISTSEQAVYAFEGVPSEQAASELYAPLFRASQKLGTNRLGDTGISVVNTETTPVDVSITFYPAGGDCDKAPVSWDHTIPASSSYVFWQGPIDDNPLKGTNCYGSARIVAANDGKILAIVNDGVNDYAGGKYNINAAAYNAVSADLGGAKAALPLFRTGHTKFNLWTGISCMNVGSAQADINMSVTNLVDGSVLDNVMSDSVGQYQTAVLWPAPVQATGAPWNDVNKAVGSATINSSQPVVCIVNDSSLSGQYDAATYNGIAISQ